jgi:hypothetical protein
MRIFFALAVLTCFLVVADEPPKGVPARPAASDYATSAQWQNATFAASLVPTKQVEHLFAFDISKSYVVFEVACYADSTAALKISREAFVVKVNASGDGIHNAEPDTVASAVQRQNLPPMPSSHGTNVQTSANIGYERGTDPYTGRPVSGVYTGGGVGVDRGGPETTPQPQQYPKPGGTPEDRRMLEAQLSARSLPEGPVNHPVAGYIFFRKSDLKAQPDGTYALQYLADEDGTGATHAVALAVPKKAR